MVPPWGEEVSSEMEPPMISVVIGTFGSSYWKVLAGRARDSVEAQTVEAELISVHGRSLHEARNEGAKRAEGDYLVFLDADDQLDPGYIAAMSASIERNMLRSDCRTFLHQPATLGVVNGREDPEPTLIPQRSLDTGNFMVIGTAVERDLFHKVGGFLDWPIYEDWCLWIRCHQAGAGFVQVPEAIYRVTVNPDSRNKQDRKTQVKYFNEIRNRHYR